MIALVIGGSGSGKSSFAEDCIVSFGNARRIYIATMYPFDEESKKRVKRHQAMRQGSVTPDLSGLRFRKAVRFFWSVCLIWWRMRCFRKTVRTKIR